MDRFGSFTSSMLDAKRRLGGYSANTPRQSFSSRIPSVRLRCFSGVEPAASVSTGVSGFVSRMVSSASGRLHGLSRFRRHRTAASHVPYGKAMDEYSCYNHFTTRTTTGFLERSWVSAFYLPDAVSDNDDNEARQVLALKMRGESFNNTSGSDIENIANVLDNSSLSSLLFRNDCNDDEASMATNSPSCELSPEGRCSCFVFRPCDTNFCSAESESPETMPDSENVKYEDACSHRICVCAEEDYDADTDDQHGFVRNNETNENVDSDADRSRPPSSRGGASIEFKLSTATIKIGKKTELNISHKDLIPKCIVTTVAPAQKSSVLQTKTIDQ